MQARAILTIAALAASCAAFPSGCSESEPEQTSIIPQRERPTIAWVLPEGDRFHGDLWLSFSTEASPLGLDTVRVPLEDGADTYSQALRTALDSEPDLLVIPPPTEAASQTLIQSVANEGAGVFLVGPGESHDATAHIRTDDTSALAAMAAYLEGQRVVIVGEPSSAANRDRVERLAGLLGQAVVAREPAVDPDVLASLAEEHPDTTFFLAVTQAAAQQLVDNQTALGAWEGVRLAGIDIIAPPRSNFPLGRFVAQIDSMPNTTGRALAAAVTAYIDEKPLEEPAPVIEAVFFAPEPD